MTHDQAIQYLNECIRRERSDEQPLARARPGELKPEQLKTHLEKLHADLMSYYQHSQKTIGNLNYRIAKARKLARANTDSTANAHFLAADILRVLSKRARR